MRTNPSPSFRRSSSHKSKNKSKGPKGRPKHPVEPKAPVKPKEPKKESTALQLAQLVDAFKTEIKAKAQIELFHTRDKECHATVEIKGHFETWALDSSDFKELLEYLWFKQYRLPLPEKLLAILLPQWKAEAKWDGPERPVFLRVGSTSSTDVYLDLCNDAWEVVHITPSGWSVRIDAPVKFIRKPGMLPLPLPQRDVDALQNLDDFLTHLNDDGRVLTKGFLLGCLNPAGPYPLLLVDGEQGTGKSTVCEIVRLLVDPAKPLTAAMPQGKRNLAIAASNSWLQTYDNVSKINTEMSDSLCQLATTFGFKHRRMFKNDTEIIFEVTRPILINSKNPGLIIAGDLADRSLISRTRIFPDNERRQHRKVMADFETKRAGILGGLCDAVSVSLRNQATVAMTRMADFASWVVAGETGLGLQPGEFMEAYTTSRASANLSALEASPIYQPLMAFVEDRSIGRAWAKDIYRDDMTKLLAMLLAYCSGSKPGSPPQGFPNNPRGLQEQLSYIAPLLRPLGILVTFPGHDNATRRSLVQIVRPAAKVKRERPETAAATDTELIIA